MAPKINVRFTDPHTNEVTDVKVLFDDEEWQLLLEYCRECDRIANSELLKNFPVRMRMAGTKGENVTLDCELPSDDAIAVCLHRLRPFILEKESTYFRKVCNVLKRRMDHPFLRSIIDYQLAEFLGEGFQQQLKVTLPNGEILNSHQKLMEWINADEYHRFDEKKVRQAAIHEAIPTLLIRTFYCNMLIDKVHAVLEIGRLILQMKDGPGVQCHVRVPDEMAG